MISTVAIALLCLTFASAQPWVFKNVEDFDEDKIVGGTAASKGEFPYQVSLQRSSWGGYSHFCGGSILNSRWVITAAHCIDGVSASSLQIVAGDHNVNANDGTEQRVRVSRIVKHAAYNSRNFENDIALLELSSPFDLSSSYAGAVKVPSSRQEFSGACIVTGWGTLREGGSLASTLQKVSVPLVSDAKCRQQYGSQIKDSMLCAGYDNGGKDACQGDSGGPLVCNSNGVQYLAGVVSWGNGCARPGYFGVYTETAYFTSWVNQYVY